jgi:GT2 family glycosyltransferase
MNDEPDHRRSPETLVSVLIINWNTRDLTLACLASLVDSADEIPYEVVVVDNGSVDGSANALAQSDDVQLIRNDRNVGFAAAVNQAYRHSSGRYVLLLNSDVRLTPTALSTLVRFLDDRPSLAGVAPLYLNPDGSPQPFHFRFPTFTTTLLNGSALARRLVPGSASRLDEYKMLSDDFSRPRQVPQPSASCLLLRRALLPASNLMDERYPLYFNDVQLARSLAARGLELWVTPEAVVVHSAHASGAMLSPPARRQQYVGGVVRMLMDTEPSYKVWVYRVLVFTQNVGLSILGRPQALDGRQLLHALAGNPEALPLMPISLDEPRRQ